MSALYVALYVYCSLSSVPVSDTLRAIVVSARVPRAGWLSGRKLSVSADRVRRPNSLSPIVGLRDPLPKANILRIFIWGASDLILHASVVGFAVLRIPCNGLREALVDGLVVELEANLGLVVESEGRGRAGLVRTGIFNAIADFERDLLRLSG